MDEQNKERKEYEQLIVRKTCVHCNENYLSYDNEPEILREMRLTRALYRQHGDFMFKRHWLVQGRRRPQDTGAIAAVKSHGIPVESAIEFVNREPPKTPFKIEGAIWPEKEVFDKTHPLWKSRKCHMFEDSNVLVHGLQQAQLLTKSIVVDGLPEIVQQAIDGIKIPIRSDAFMQDAFRTSFLFDAEQLQLPKRRLPDRPAFNLPRDYGITSLRRHRLLVSKAIQECEKLAGQSVAFGRNVVNDALFVVPIEKDGNVLQMEITVEAFLASRKPIGAVSTNETEFSEIQLPDLFPSTYTVSLPQKHIYQLRDIYPITRTSTCSNPHTIFLDTENTLNEYELPVTETQINSRSMIKAFSVAASRARSLYGPNVNDLEKPIVVQCICADVKQYQSIHFGVFQLNTLNLDGVNGTKNVWFNGPTMKLFSECQYSLARPTFVGYNPDVFRYIYGFYKTN